MRNHDDTTFAELAADCEIWATEVDNTEMDARLAALDAGRKAYEAHAVAELEAEALTHVDVFAPMAPLDTEEEILCELAAECESWATEVDDAETDARLAALDAGRKAYEARATAEMEEEMLLMQARDALALDFSTLKYSIRDKSCSARPNSIRLLRFCSAEERRAQRWNKLHMALDELGHTTHTQAVHFHTRAMGTCC